MAATAGARWPWIAPILIYAVSALEMIIMISPAAAYFYSVYTPLFHGLEQSSLTAWLPQFFLPHLAQTQLPYFRWLSWLGIAMALVGLIGFLACAIQLYYGKLVKKRVVTGGLYGRVRHPQYLCLAIAGAGFLLLWPRFFILATYLMMLGLYYVLARHEEETIRRRYGAPAEQYLATVPMFNPFRRRRAAAAPPPPRSRAFANWLALCAGCLGVAFLLRALAVSQLQVLRSESPPVTAVALQTRDVDDFDALTRAVLESPAVRTRLSEDGAPPLFVQIVRGSSSLKHLLIDLGMREDAVDDIASGEPGDFAVVSRVEGRSGVADPAADPLALGTRIEPLYLARLYGPEGQAEVTELAEASFHPRFSRIRF